MGGDVTIGESGLPIDDEMFVREWMTNGYKVADAYLKTWPGVTKQTAGIKGNAKLKEPLIAAYAAGVIKAHLDQYDVTEDTIIKELAGIAFLDIADLVDKDGSVIGNANEMPEKARRAVAAITEDREGKITLKLCNKEKALELLAKYKKMLTDMHEIAGVEDLAAAILGARKRTTTETTTTVVDDLLK